ncbi:MAG: replication-relaxation family protein [Rubrobacter sp.]|nr:replication-relaxation family protein [Rubrobacter sp.]
MPTTKNMRLTERDEAILTDLYFTRLLSTEQVRAKHFNAYNTAKSRLYDLRDMKYIEPSTPYRGLTVWMLTRGAFEREIENLNREGERYKGWPKARAIPHFVDSNDVFIGIARTLDRKLGEHPAWEWKDQARITQHRGRGVKQRNQKLPDAEISFAGHRFLLERQTGRAKAKKEEIVEKITGHQRYIRRLDTDAENIEVLFACDVERDMDYAVDAAEERQIAMTAGTPGQIIEHLLDTARESTRAATAQ